MFSPTAEIDAMNLSGTVEHRRVDLKAQKITDTNRELEVENSNQKNAGTSHDTETKYEVENIRDVYFCPIEQEVLYEVKWKGFPASQNTLQSKDTLHEAKESLERFLRSEKNRKRQKSAEQKLRDWRATNKVVRKSMGAPPSDSFLLRDAKKSSGFERRKSSCSLAARSSTAETTSCKPPRKKNAAASKNVTPKPLEKDRRCRRSRRVTSRAADITIIKVRRLANRETIYRVRHNGFLKDLKFQEIKALDSDKLLSFLNDYVE